MGKNDHKSEDFSKSEVTRRAFLSSKSNTAAGEIEFQHGSQKVGKNESKSEDF